MSCRYPPQYWAIYRTRTCSMLKFICKTPFPQNVSHRCEDLPLLRLFINPFIRLSPRIVPSRYRFVYRQLVRPVPHAIPYSPNHPCSISNTHLPTRCPTNPFPPNTPRQRPRNTQRHLSPARFDDATIGYHQAVASRTQKIAFVAGTADRPTETS